MGKIIELRPDTLRYIKDDDGQIIGVGDDDSGVTFINSSPSNGVFVTGSQKTLFFIKNEKFKELCIAWLLLNCSDIDLRNI